ncbi:MAG TPA: hypothetical protein VFS32_09850 [Candidatus Limnocylindrales bacterium]|nr:hypothetical protein [Candidatus Limnocylindrales bacterium]
MTPTTGQAVAPAPIPGPTHGCARCGAEVPIDVGLCERCNPLGLKDVAASQVHGSVFLAIAVGVAILAVLGRLSLSGIGPFDGQVAAVVSSPPGLSVTLVVANHGTRAGSASCRLYDPDSPGIGPESVSVESPRIDAGRSATFSALMTTLGTTVRPVAVTCSGP